MIGRLAMVVVAWVAVAAQAQVRPDLTAYDPACEVKVETVGKGIAVSWLDETGKPMGLEVALDGAPLLSSIDVEGKSIAKGVDISYDVRTGTRTDNPRGYIFFDNPYRKPMERFSSKLSLESARVTSSGKRVTIAVSKLAAGPFSGELLIHVYAGSPLIHVEAAMTQYDKTIAYIYDAVLRGDVRKASWKNLSDNWETAAAAGEPKPVAVRGRTIFGEFDAGSIAIFPPPHAFFFPRDYTNNLKFAQVGEQLIGLRQDYTGGGSYVPWFDSHPGKVQRMGMFLMPTALSGEEALARVLRYTHNDSFKPMEGRKTFTSHFHSRLTVGKTPVPEFVHVMKTLGVNIVHLSDFHGDGNPDDPGPKRLPELRKYFEICRDFSDDQLALLPGEEGNKYLGKPAAPGNQPGHWSYFFPRPVYFTFVRRPGEPFEETIRPYGRVYHVGSTADMVELLQRENGLAWTTHPRIKASNFAPDAFKDEAWYKDPMWLGAAWKAMPGDLSDDRLGRRCLDLLDDMNNWGQRKYLPGEVDVFEIDRTHELYGHMNINYLKLDKMPGGEEWGEVLDVLRRGDFFVTTGEILIHSCDVTKTGVKVDLEWTYPLAFAEVIWGDGQKVNRKRIDLSATKEMGRERYEWPVDLSGAKWARFEAWDVATNGAFTQPVDPK